MPMADIPPLFSSKRYRKKRRTVGDKEKTIAYMKEYRKKGPDRNRKNITMLTRNRARKRPFASSELYNETVSSDVSGQASMCCENQHKQANCLKVMNS